MRTIKFSSDYKKLPTNANGTQAVLIAVEHWQLPALKNRSPAFIRYDTEFRGKEGKYDLNFDDALILVFIHQNTGIPFTTIRRNYGNKEEYYLGHIRESFVIEVLEGYNG